MRTASKLLLCVFTAIALSGCNNNPETRFQKEMERANTLNLKGQISEAIAILEELSQDYSDRPEVFEALAQAQMEQGDLLLSAFYYEQAGNLDLGHPEFYLSAARFYGQEGDQSSATKNYRNYLASEPNDPVAWKALAETYKRQNNAEGSLEAYVKYSQLSEGKAEPEVALSIAQLYFGENRNNESKRWFKIVTQDDRPEAQSLQGEAQLGLLRIALKTRDWARAENLLDRLSDSHPGVLAKADLSKPIAEMKAWREKKAAEQKQREIEEAVTVAKMEAVSEPTEPQSGPATSAPGATDDIAHETDHDSMPVFAQSADPTRERRPNPAPEQLPSAAPEPTEETLVEETTAMVVAQAPAPAQAQPEPTVGEAPKPTPKPNFRHYLREAKDAAQKGNREEAITQYWNALAKDDKRPDVWFELSQNYFKAQQFQLAESTALEAIRRDLNNIPYTLHYLKVVQKNQGPNRLMEELKRAKDRFPKNAEVTLALARGYERIEKDTHNARFLYEEFLNLSPKKHPLRSQAQMSLERL